MQILHLGAGADGSLEASLCRALRALGCNVDFFDTSGHGWTRWLRAGGLPQRAALRAIRAVNRRTLGHRLDKRTASRRYDLILCHKTMEVPPQVLAALRERCGALLFCYYPDHPFDPHPTRSNANTRGLVPRTDVYFTFGRFIVPELERAGARRVEVLPFAHDPLLHAPPVLTAAEAHAFAAQVAFVGGHSEERAAQLAVLLDLGLAIYGYGWHALARHDRRWRKAVRGGMRIGREFAAVYAGAAIGLNLIQVYPDGHNMRSFEAPACGGFVLSTRTSELLELFREGAEIECFSDVHELRGKVERYLADPGARRRIAAAGRARVAGETYEKRAARILEVWEEEKRGA